MDRRIQKHEKIRFRRQDISELSAFPSAAGHGHLWRQGSGARRVVGWIATAATVLTSVVVIGVLVVYLVLTNGIGTDRLGDEAEAAIRSLSGLDVEASFGPARVSVDRSQFLAVSVPDVSLKSKSDGAPLLHAGSIDFGVRALPLLGGSIQLGSARVSDARLFAAALATGGPSDPLVAVRNADGLVDPDLVAPVLFNSVHQLFEALDAGSTHEIELERVEILSGADDESGSLLIDNASLEQVGSAGLEFAADLVIEGRPVAIDGSATREPGSGRISELKLEVKGDGPAETVDQVGGAASGVARDMLGDTDVTLAGEEGADGSPSKLTLNGTIGRSTFAIDKESYLEGEIALSASITSGENKVRIERLEVTQDRSRYVLFGPIGPRPVADGQPAAYRFELASDDSVSAPDGSTEPAMPFSARLGGIFNPEASRLEISSIDIRTSSGGLAARGAVDLVPGKAPGVDLAVSVAELSVSHVKQIWPFTAAGNARNWAMTNLFGGNLANGRILYRVPPGRIGNGVPLSADEVSGHVEISGARFDITEGIPPMRDAAAAIDFRGNDVDVAFSAGALFLPDGKSISATNGTFTIRDAYKPVVVGQLEVDVAGDASSVARLASYEPIDGLSRTGLTPEAFSGDVTGHVSTQIPLAGGLDMKDLAWRVSLDFRDLALSEPVEDQFVSDATGNITIDPLKAEIKAKAKMNGAPADIAMVEPVRDSGPPASRDVSMVLDNKALEEIAPGIGVLVAGPVSVAFASAGNDGDRQVEADLTDSKLDIPWIGWSKGPGVSASAAFTLKRDGGLTRLRGFKLSGKSFAISGDIAIADGGLASARLGSVRLNRGDDASVSIERDGKGFDIAVKGEALDVRALIKLLKSDEETAGEDSKRPISVTATIGRLLGFNDEALSNVSVTYSGAGAAVGSAKVTATTASGAKVSMQDRTRDGVRSLEMRSSDGGAVLRFLDIYEHMVGGDIRFSLAGPSGGTLSGEFDTTDFQIVDEPKLRSLVASTPSGSDRSLSQAVKRDIDTTRVRFERGYALVDKGKAGLVLNKGVLRGPVIGSTFQGMLRDRDGNMDMTGTFMPAYGINRLFGELPLVGLILGNGRDRGLIGVTFRLSGDADEPQLQVNPLSVIAPGIFRSIFEYR